MPDKIVPNNNENSNVSSSDEVAIHELGEALAVSAVSIRRELQRYPDEMGSFTIEDFEVDLPVRMRVDSLGQVMATVLPSAQANDAVARVRIRLKPGEKQVNAAPVIADYPVKALDSFSGDEIKTLEKHRIFSVEDFIRVCRNTAGRTQLEKLVSTSSIERALKPAELLTMPSVPGSISLGLIKNNIRSAEDFLGNKPEDLAHLLQNVPLEKIHVEDIQEWQKATNLHMKRQKMTNG